ncbi:hypothetical protein ACFC1G_14505 [Streptomyces sp. NPDC056085]|uniref:hypothetical protein n=1 Tax=Streptomyces sp. NPDC056085 TaxID=3345708 RepID=UPI0035D84ABC
MDDLPVGGIDERAASEGSDESWPPELGLSGSLDVGLERGARCTDVPVKACMWVLPPFESLTYESEPLVVGEWHGAERWEVVNVVKDRLRARTWWTALLSTSASDR